MRQSRRTLRKLAFFQWAGMALIAFGVPGAWWQRLALVVGVLFVCGSYRLWEPYS